MSTLRVLGVHGVGNYQPGLQSSDAAERLAGWWKAAIVKGLGADVGVELNMVYYAHHLTPVGGQGVSAPERLGEGTQQLVMRLGQLLGAPDEIAQGRLTAPIRALVSWVARQYGLDDKLTGRLVTAFFGEVEAYFTNTAARAAAMAEITAAAELAPPDVIIAHSLGSAVAYDSLWANGQPATGLFLTLGSPMAMPDIVYDRLWPHKGNRRRPPSAVKWINIADPGDFIAVPPKGISAQFEGVAADLVDAIGAFDFHRASGYLSCGATAGLLAGLLPP